MRYKAQELPSCALSNSYDDEDTAFKKTGRTVSLNQIPSQGNGRGSQVIYKMKVNDDKSIKMKARIAPRGNEDYYKSEMKSDCSMCSPVVMRIWPSAASLNPGRVHKLDVPTDFLQTGAAQWYVYVILPVYRRDRQTTMWLLLVYSYGVINANVKWQV